MGVEKIEKRSARILKDNYIEIRGWEGTCAKRGRHASSLRTETSGQISISSLRSHFRKGTWFEALLWCWMNQSYVHGVSKVLRGLKLLNRLQSVGKCLVESGLALQFYSSIGWNRCTGCVKGRGAKLISFIAK